MAERNNQASCCTFVASRQAEICRLPLLDGEAKESAENITTEIELEDADRLSDLCRRDGPFFYGTICTAWALLLRCYTGQDQITFRFDHNVNATASVLQVVFDENKSLSTHVENATDAISCIKQEELSAQASVDTESSSHPANTVVCVSGSGTSRKLGAKQTLEVSNTGFSQS